MRGIFTWIGVAAVAVKLLGGIASNVMDKIIVGFGGLKFEDFNLFGGSVKLRLVITNNNPVEASIRNFTGTLYFGTISAPVSLEKEFTTPPGQQVIAGFSAELSNGLILQQIAAQIESGGVPALRIVGSVTAGIRDKVVTLPVSQTLQIL